MDAMVCIAIASLNLGIAAAQRTATSRALWAGAACVWVVVGLLNLRGGR